MALDNDNGMVMPVTPTGFGNGFGNAGDGGLWIILLFILLCNGGWGNGFGGYGNGGVGFVDNSVQRGFDQSAVMSGITGVSNNVVSGFGDIQTALCGGFAGVNQNVSNSTATIQNSLCNGFNGVNQSINGAQNALAQQLYTNQISDLERSFAAQTANTAAITALQAQNADCCCRTQTNIADLKYAVASENCADRTQAMQNTRDIIDAQTRNTQAVLDKLCQLELDNYKNQVDAKNDQIAQLRQEVLYARGQASQVDQTARILAGQAAEIDGVYNRLKNCPVNTVPVYGNQPIFSCPQTVGNYGCGCGAA